MAQEASLKKETTVAALTVGPERRRTREPHGERPGHTRQRPESDELWPFAERWRWTGYGKPQKRKQM
eukprot:6214398-Pleurochrysis_carterae.AAC.5